MTMMTRKPGLWTLAEAITPRKIETASQAAPLVRKNITGWRSERSMPARSSAS